MRFKKLLVPVDFSPPSREAFETACAMGADNGAEVVLVHVVPPYVRTVGIAEPELDDSRFAASVKAELDDLEREATRAGVKRVSTKIVTGAPWHEIVEAAKDPTFDLIVIGTYGRTGLKHVLLGSVAEKVVRHAPCPVLTVRVRE